MKKRFISALEEVRAANDNGEIKNLLITDDNAEFLDDALYAVRYWAVKNGINLVEIDERDDAWLPEIQSRELFEKLNQPSSVLLVKNYAANNVPTEDYNTPRNFLRDAALHRHYGCGNDFVPSDELPNLLFVIALNDLSGMAWRRDEYSCFSVMHEDDNKRVWTNTHYMRPDSKMYPIMSPVNKTIYFVTEDETTLCFDIGLAFNAYGYRRPLRAFKKEQRTEIIHGFLESHIPDCSERVDSLILKMSRFATDDHFVLDGARLKQIFPNLGMIYCKDNFEIENNDELYTMDPFDLGEMCFLLAQEGDIPAANSFTRELWAFDRWWAKFYREVAIDWRCKPEDHDKYCPLGAQGRSGMDHLFRIYLLGWCSFGSDADGEHKLVAPKHQNFDKALELLQVRFANWNLDEICEKLYWDMWHVTHDESFDRSQFAKVLAKVEQLYPEVIAKLRERVGMDSAIEELLKNY